MVPTLIDEGATIYESSFINEFLEDSYPEMPLRPSDPVACWHMRYRVKHEEEALFPAIRPATLNLIMKQVFGRYSDDELDEFLTHHLRSALGPVPIPG